MRRKNSKTPPAVDCLEVTDVKVFPLPNWRKNGPMKAIAAVILLGQIAMVYVPGFNDMFNCVPLSMTDFLIIVGLSSLVMWVGEFTRLLRKKK